MFYNKKVKALFISGTGYKVFFSKYMEDMKKSDLKFYTLH